MRTELAREFKDKHDEQYTWGDVQGVIGMMRKARRNPTKQAKKLQQQVMALTEGRAEEKGERTRRPHAPV